MNGTYTTTEQSRELLELGLNPETADFWYIKPDPGKINRVVAAWYVKPAGNDLPAWSAGLLLELLPESIDDCDLIYQRKGRHLAYINKEGGILVGFNHPGEDSIPYYREGLRDLAYQMVRWVLKHNYKLSDKVTL